MFDQLVAFGEGVGPLSSTCLDEFLSQVCRKIFVEECICKEERLTPKVVDAGNKGGDLRLI